MQSALFDGVSMTSEQIAIARELLGYDLPKLKAIEHKGDVDMNLVVKF